MSFDSNEEMGLPHSPSEREAQMEALRVMFGFRDRDDVEELFAKPLVRNAMANLESALKRTRAQSQPDEFALALAVEMELLKQARARGYDLEKLFNDSRHHTPPSPEIVSLIASLWTGK